MLCGRLVVTIVVSVVVAAVWAEQVPCKTDQSYCSGLSSLSIINNNYFCCDNGFNMQWKNELNNDTSISTCVCNRHFYETDCIEGHAECQNAHSLMSDGYTTKCCKNGDSMNSVSNSFINGVKVDYCKCIRYVGSGTSGGAYVNVGGVFRPMTSAEQAQFQSAMTQWSQELQAGMNQLSKTLSQNLGLLDFNFGQNQARQNRPWGFRNWAGNVFDRLGRGFRKRFGKFGTADTQLASNATSTSGYRRTNTVPLALARPSLTWDTRRRRLQQLQRRLQQGRFDRNPIMDQMMNPRSWFGRSLRGIFSVDNNTTRDPIPSSSNNTNYIAPTNRYNSPPASNLNATL